MFKNRNSPIVILILVLAGIFILFGHYFLGLVLILVAVWFAMA